VKSIHPCKSAPECLRRAGVIQTMYVVVKAHGGEIKVKTKEGEARPDDPVGRGSEFVIELPVV